MTTMRQALPVQLLTDLGSRADGLAAITVRVASVPSDHVYVRHLQPVTPGSFGAGFATLAEPEPSDPNRPAMLDADWVAAHHGDFDVFHIHFGFETTAPADLRRLVEELRRHGKPLVYTAHDLEGPTTGDQSLHQQQLEVLIPAANEIITLSPTAAALIDRRWGRDALVLGHPHVVPLHDMVRLQARSAESAGRPFVIGVHLESLPSTMAPRPVLETLVRGADAVPDSMIRVDLHRDALDPAGERYDDELVRALRSWDDEGRIELVVHDPFTDAQLFDYLAELDVSVLPFLSGSHASWLAACQDVGTRVIAPRGTVEPRGPVSSYCWAGAGRLDEDSLLAALHEVYDGGVAVPATTTHRMLKRDLVAVAHDRLYRSLLGWPA